MIRATSAFSKALCYSTILAFALIAPALAQTTTVDRLGVGGLGSNTVTVIDRADYPITMQVMRFNDGPDTGRVHEMAARVYCRDGPQDTGITSCMSVELDSESAASNGSGTLNLTPTKRGTGSIRALHATVRDFSDYTAAESEGVFVAEIGIMASGAEDYAHSRLGKRQGIRFVGKTTCGSNREGTVEPCPPGEGAAEIGTGFAVLTNPQYPTVTIGTAFAVEEVWGAGRIDVGFRCDISGTCLDAAPGVLWVARLNGGDILMREMQDGTPITLNGELAKLKRMIVRLQRRVAELEAQ